MSVFVGYWYAAFDTQFGVVISTNNPTAMIQKLYAARREALDPNLDALSILMSPTKSDEIWIVQRIKGTPYQRPRVTDLSDIEL